MQNYKKVFAIKAEAEKRIDELFMREGKIPPCNDSGIYVFYRYDNENKNTVFYVGQAKHLKSRLAEHLVGYQHIDLSIKKHGLWGQQNGQGYRAEFRYYPQDELNEKEREYIQKCIDKGWETRNKTSGGQDTGKAKIAEYRPSKTYRDGLAQGYKNAKRDVAHLFDKYLKYELKVKPTLNAQKALQKFEYFIDLKEQVND